MTVTHLFFDIGGVMYDRPHRERARQLLARATNLSKAR